MKNLILIALVVMSLGTGVASAQGIAGAEPQHYGAYTSHHR
jgi:hypothetical protein